MSYDWKSIREIEDDEGQYYRLLGEMMQRRASTADLDQIRDFLLENEPSGDVWRGLGEALFHTSSAGEAGFRLWSTWVRSNDNLHLTHDQLRATWLAFGEGGVVVAAEPVEIPVQALEDDEPPTDVVDAEPEPDSEDGYFDFSGISNTAVIRFPRPTLLSYVPSGRYTIRFMNEVYDSVDEYHIVRLLRRGLLLGAEVRFNDLWVPVNAHPAFEGLSRVMLDEVRRVLRDSTHTDRVDTTTFDKTSDNA